MEQMDFGSEFFESASLPGQPLAPLEPDDWPFDPTFKVHPTYRLQAGLEIFGELSSSALAIPAKQNLHADPARSSASLTDVRPQRRRRDRIQKPAHKIVTSQTSVRALLEQKKSAGCIDPIFVPADSTVSVELLLAILCRVPALVEEKSDAFEVLRGNDLLRHIERHPELGPQFAVPAIRGEAGFLHVLATSIVAAALWEGGHERARYFLKNPELLLKHFRVGRESIVATVARATGLREPTIRKIQKELTSAN